MHTSIKALNGTLRNENWLTLWRPRDSKLWETPRLVGLVSFFEQGGL
jgi:hypothetical protein